MLVRSNKPVIFSTDLCWSGDGKGLITSQSANHGISITTSTNASADSEWSSEQLLLGAVISSLLSAFLDISKKIKLEMVGFECTATAQTDIIDGKALITFIHTYPKVFVNRDADIERALVALEKAKKICPLYHSINADIVQHPEAVIAKKKNAAA